MTELQNRQGIGGNSGTSPAGRWGGMRSLLGIVALVTGISAVLSVTGCNTQGCTDNQSALPLMGFYSGATERSMILDSIDMGGVGAPNDSLLVKSGQKVSTLYLPFRFDRDATAFFIHYDYKEQGLDNPALNDTVTFRYRTEPYFSSVECGAYYKYIIGQIEYTRHLIDSVAIVDSVINNVDMERIKIFIRTTQPESEAAKSNPGGTPRHNGMKL